MVVIATGGGNKNPDTLVTCQFGQLTESCQPLTHFHNFHNLPDLIIEIISQMPRTKAIPKAKKPSTDMP